MKQRALIHSSSSPSLFFFLVLPKNEKFEKKSKGEPVSQTMAFLFPLQEATVENLTSNFMELFNLPFPQSKKLLVIAQQSLVA